jgi:Fic-DOC domain mobile mystery protein B
MNIQSALGWASRSKKLRAELVSLAGIKLLHKRMFDLTWKWAGTFRAHNTNLGVSWPTVPEEVQKLCANVRYWEAHETYPVVERAVLFHHKLVLIHPFANGNGRLSRLVADLYLEHREQPQLSWSASADLARNSDVRGEYLAALRDADAGRIHRLLRFATG